MFTFILVPYRLHVKQCSDHKFLKTQFNLVFDLHEITCICALNAYINYKCYITACGFSGFFSPDFYICVNQNLFQQNMEDVNKVLIQI